jgi:hypothetical protein
MSETFTREEMEKASENLLWAQGLVDYILRIGTRLEEGESISILRILEILLKDAAYIYDPLTLDEVFTMTEADENSEAENE